MQVATLYVDRLSVTATPVCAVPLLVLLMVSVSVVEPPDVIFFFNDTATTEIYTLSLHDALPILPVLPVPPLVEVTLPVTLVMAPAVVLVESKGTPLQSLHGNIAPVMVSVGNTTV